MGVSTLTNYYDRLWSSEYYDQLFRFIAFAWFGFFIVVPILIMVIISLQPTTDKNIFVFEYTLANYREILDRTYYLNVLLDTIKIAAITGFTTMVIAYPAAYYLGVKAPKKLQYPALLAVITPMWTLFILRVYAWLNILGSNGAVPSMLHQFGLVGSQYSLLYSEAAVVIVLTQIWAPMGFLPLYSSMDAIKVEHLEAAVDLGGSRWDIFRYIILPLTLPGAFAGFLLVFLPALGTYVIPLLVGGKEGFMFAQIIASQFLSGYDWTLGAALAVVLVSILLAITAVLQRVVDFQDTLAGV